MTLPHVDIFVWAMVLSFIITLSYRFLTKPEEMRKIKEEMKFYKEKSNEARKNKNMKKSEEYLATSRDEFHRTRQDVIRLKELTARELDKQKIETVDAAKKEALSILEKAELDIKREIRNAKEEARKDVASLAVDIARKILDREMKPSDHKRLLEESLREINREG